MIRNHEYTRHDVAYEICLDFGTFFVRKLDLHWPIITNDLKVFVLSDFGSRSMSEFRIYSNKTQNVSA